MGIFRSRPTAPSDLLSRRVGRVILRGELSEFVIFRWLDERLSLLSFLISPVRGACSRRQPQLSPKVRS